jgi:oligo-1,6-glucosidase
MAYAFDAVDIAKPEGYSLLYFKNVFSRWDSAFAKNGWLSIFLANHDQARLVTRFGNDSPKYRDISSKMLTTFIMTMRGTPYYYNGDELGMTNIRFDKIEDYRDVPTLNEYQYQKNIGGNLANFMELIKFSCRDNGRTPFQWDNTPFAGFSTTNPWLKVNPNYLTLNAETQEKALDSPLNYFKKIVTLRKNNPVLVYGKYTLLDKNNPSIYAYTREFEGQKMLILLNFSSSNAKTIIDVNTKKARLILSNYPQVSVKNSLKSIVTLRPYESIIYKL